MKNYRINKYEVSDNTHIISETVYTYYDDEEITDEMVSKPEIKL